MSGGELSWSIFLDKSADPLPSFYVNENGVEKKFFIVPASPTLLRYRVSVSHTAEKSIGAMLTVDNKCDELICVFDNSQGDVKTIADDYLAFAPIALAKDDDDQDYSFVTQTLGTLTLKVYELTREVEPDAGEASSTSGTEVDHESVDEQSESPARQLSDESCALPECKATKVIGVNTVSGGKAPAASLLSGYVSELIATLHGGYATAENFSLRQMLPARFFSLLNPSTGAKPITTAGAKRSAAAVAVGATDDAENDNEPPNKKKSIHTTN